MAADRSRLSTEFVEVSLDCMIIQAIFWSAMVTAISLSWRPEKSRMAAVGRLDPLADLGCIADQDIS